MLSSKDMDNMTNKTNSMSCYPVRIWITWQIRQITCHVIQYKDMDNMTNQNWSTAYMCSKLRFYCEITPIGYSVSKVNSNLNLSVSLLFYILLTGW